MAEEVYVSGPTHIVCDTFSSQTNARKNLADEKTKPKSKDPVDIKEGNHKQKEEYYEEQHCYVCSLNHFGAVVTHRLGSVIYIGFDVSRNIAHGILVFHVTLELAPPIGWNTMMTS